MSGGRVRCPARGWALGSACRRAKRWSLVLLATGWAAVLLALAGCGVSVATHGPAPTRFVTPTNPYIPLSVLHQDPAAAIRFPAAESILGRGERDTELVLGGYRPADIGDYLGTQASVPEVFAYYDHELRAVGYTFIPGGAALSTTETDAWIWCSPRAIYRLAIVIQSKLDFARYLQGRTFATVYGVMLTGEDGSGCAPPRPATIPAPRP